MWPGANLCGFRLGQIVTLLFENSLLMHRIRSNLGRITPLLHTADLSAYIILQPDKTGNPPDNKEGACNCVICISSWVEIGENNSCSCSVIMYGITIRY